MKLSDKASTEPAQAAEPSYTSKTMRGAFWALVSRVGQQVLSLCSMAILARLIAPAAYGLMNMATLFTVFLDLFRDMGTTMAIVQRETVDDYFLSSVFWLNLTIGCVASALVCAVAIPASWFFHEPQVANLLFVLAVNFPISSTVIVHSALLSRGMRFDRSCIAEISAAVVGALTAIICGLQNMGAWALAAASIANTSTFAVSYWILCSWRPKVFFRWSDIRSILSFSMNVTGFALVNYAGRNADNMIIGRRIGASALGYYGMAYNLMLYPTQSLGSVLGRVLFPAFSRMQNDTPRLRAAYVRSAGAMAAILFPVLLGLMVTAHEFIRVMLSAKWEPAIPIFLVLVPVGLVQTMISPTGHLYTSTGRSDLYFKVGLFSNILNITAFLIGIHWGAMGVAIAYLITSYVVALPLLKIGFSLIDLSLTEYAKWIAPQLGIGLGMAAVAFGWKQGMKAMGLSDPLFLLVTTSTVGALFYCILLFRIRPAGVQELLGYADRFPIARRIIGVLGGQPA